jgi:hypothetical protein
MAVRRRGLVGDLGELPPRLERIVERDVRGAAPVIEDACEFAWSRLVCHAHRVAQGAALTWLAGTAVHEALKLTAASSANYCSRRRLSRPANCWSPPGLPARMSTRSGASS